MDGRAAASADVRRLADGTYFNRKLGALNVFEIDVDEVADLLAGLERSEQRRLQKRASAARRIPWAGGGGEATQAMA